ncbi:MAG: NAD regulator [Rhizobiales bacterium]|nr:NAD regulator [Hyphomicrobiales bacterium]
MNKTEKKSVIEIGLNAAIVSLEETDPHILTVLGNDENHDGLPFGPFDPLVHRTMEIGVRGFVREQTGLDVSYVEQLYTFGDRGRVDALESGELHVVSIGYLALTRKIDHDMNSAQTGAVWWNWYRSFPWEDWRNGPPEIIETELVPRLMKWAKNRSTTALQRRAVERVNICFGVSGSVFDEEKVLDRYELLYEAGLLFEAKRDGREAALDWDDVPKLGEPMILDHRRIVATAMSRIRAKIKYRPVIFDLMPENFTLLELQQSVEGISGNLLHKQNFRRLVENGGLVVPTGKMTSQTGGRPAKLFRFRKEVLLERRTAGVRVRV